MKNVFSISVLVWKLQNYVNPIIVFAANFKVSKN